MTCVRVGVIPKALGNSAFELARIGAEEAIAELDDAELIFDGPVRPTIAGQIAAIEDLVARGVDVLALDANDPRKLLPGLRVAERRGIHIMTWDAGVETGGRLLHVCPSRDEVLATVWLQLLCDAISGEGSFLVHFHQPAVTDNVGGENGGNLTFDTLLGHALRPTVKTTPNM